MSKDNKSETTERVPASDAAEVRLRCQYCDNLYPEDQIHKFTKYVPHHYVTHQICDDCLRKENLTFYGFNEIAI